jgi:hypothetical protein
MNGGTHVLYDQPPYAFGSRDDRVEDSRGTDVGAMMWAILPYTMVQREALAAGEFPLWNRYNAIGEPLWGQGQTFILDPMHLLSLAIPDPALAMDLRFIAGRATFAIGTGLTVALVTGHAPAAVLVTLMAPFVGHFTARFNHPAYFSLVWAPWILLAYAHLARQQTLGTRLRAGAWLALATWLQLVGSTPKEGVIALGAAHLAGLLGLLSAGGPGAIGWDDSMPQWSPASTAVLLGAPHWLIFLDTLAKSWTLYDQPSVQLADRHFLLAYMVGPTMPGAPLTGAHPLAVMAALAALCAPRALLRSGVGLGAAVATAAVGGIAFGLIPAEWLERLPLVANIHQVANVVSRRHGAAGAGGGGRGTGVGVARWHDGPAPLGHGRGPRTDDGRGAAPAAVGGFHAAGVGHRRHGRTGAGAGGDDSGRANGQHGAGERHGGDAGGWLGRPAGRLRHRAPRRRAHPASAPRRSRCALTGDCRAAVARRG